MLMRIFDIVFSLFAMIILLPFMIPIMIGLKITGEHYIFYRQPRVGRGGRDFNMLKFATMLKASPNLAGGDLTQKNDPRILPMGKLLRKTKINELPQLLNILAGQMSIVGPRPVVRNHYNFYSDEIKFAIEKIPPGLTGIGSIVFRDEESILDEVPGERGRFHDTVVAPYKGELEVWWTEHRGVMNYFKIILLTGWSLVSPRTKLWKTWFKGLPAVPAALLEMGV